MLLLKLYERLGKGFILFYENEFLMKNNVKYINISIKYIYIIFNRPVQSYDSRVIHFNDNGISSFFPHAPS